MHAILAAALLCALNDSPAQIPAESKAVCRISTGCTGVCVHPRGIILSADHCGAPGNAHATFEDLGSQALEVIYDPPQDGIDQATLFAVQNPHNAFPTVAIATRRPQVGDDVFAIGYPIEGRNGPKWTMSRGRITHTNYAQAGSIRAEDAIRCDFPVWGGNSGGPLFNAQGELIGLCSQSDRNSHSVWIGPQSITHALAECPGGKCPNGGIRLGPPVEIEFPHHDDQVETPAPEPPQSEAGSIDTIYELYKLLQPAPQAPPTPAPEVPATDNRLYDLIMVAATTAGTIFGLKWLPSVVQLLLSLFGVQLIRKTKAPPDGNAAQ